MAGSWWRLLAAFLLILVAGLLRGQESAADRTPPPSDPQPFLPVRPSANAMVRSEFFRLGIALPNTPIGHYPPVTGPIGFAQIVHPAGIIFSGTVTAISHGAPEKRAATAITFKVDTPFRGVSRGQILTIHEWAGLWSRGERYRLGERVFLFLYRPSKLGLTSPVAGGMGRFQVDSSGRILLGPPHIHLFANDPILAGKPILLNADFARALERVGRE